MTIINLADPELSEIPLKISHFPDGQKNVEFTSFYPDGANSYKIISEFKNFDDLQLILAVKACLEQLAFSPHVVLRIPYLLGARSDRKFTKLGNSYLVQVLAPILNQAGFARVESLDPHSDVSAACIKNFEGIEPIEQIRNFAKTVSEMFLEDLVLVSPDAGAYKRIYKIAQDIGFKGDIITCSKYRDTEGNLVITVPITKITIGHQATKFLIIDDLCDGGRTFIDISQKIQAFGAKPDNVFLYITHGIFSAGLNPLLPHFGRIGCTNSYRKELSDIALKTPKLVTYNVY